MSVETVTSLPEGTFNIDPIHSSISFRIPHALVATFRGGFDGVSGSLQDGVLSGEVPAAGLNVGKLEMFTNHMLSADWFDAETYPVIGFKSTEISADGDKIKFVGDFTLKGVTKQITGTGTARGPVGIPGQDGTEQQKLGIEINAVIDRTEFGITADGGAGNEVTLDIALELVQA